MAKNKNNQKSNIQIEAHFGLQLRYSSATVKRSVVAAGDLSFFLWGAVKGFLQQTRKASDTMRNLKRACTETRKTKKSRYMCHWHSPLCPSRFMKRI
jgi:hypothetical protein